MSMYPCCWMENRSCGKGSIKIMPVRSITGNENESRRLYIVIPYRLNVFPNGQKSAFGNDCRFFLQA